MAKSNRIKSLTMEAVWSDTIMEPGCTYLKPNEGTEVSFRAMGLGLSNEGDATTVADLNSCVNHKNFSQPLSKYVNDSNLRLNGYYLNYNEAIGGIKLFLFYNNGVAYYEDIRSVSKTKMNQFINDEFLNSEDLNKNPGTFRIANSKLDIQIIAPTNNDFLS